MKKRIRVRKRSQNDSFAVEIRRKLKLFIVSLRRKRLQNQVRTAAKSTQRVEVAKKRPESPRSAFFARFRFKNFDFKKLDFKKLDYRRLGIVLGGVVAVVVLCVVLFSGGGEKNAPVASLDAALPATTPAPTPTPVPTPSPSPTPAPTPHPLNEPFFEGIDSPIIMEVQERLMDLGYMDKDEPTEHFGPVTEGAVSLFQRQHDLQADGAIGAETYTALMSASAQKYLVQEGVKGEDVRELQDRLHEMGYLSAVTSYFGTDTAAAVKRFQDRNGLSPDGKIGEGTREMLYSEEARANAYSYGDEGPEIKRFQERLIKLAYYTGSADGKNGRATVNAIKRFQERNGLIADGHVGPETRRRLLSSDAQANALVLGMRGSDVEDAQARLKELKYLKNATGYFGTDTESAVIAFQKNNKLSADGKIGKATLSALLSSRAKAWTSSNPPPKASGGSSGSSSSKGSGSGSAAPPTNLSGVEGLIAAAESRLGCKYVRGGKGPNTFDCSGLVYWSLNQAGVRQGYMTSGGWAKTEKYPTIGRLSNAQRGDILVFDGHVGIAIGGGKMIDASSGQGKVRIANLSTPYWSREYICGYRIF